MARERTPEMIRAEIETTRQELAFSVNDLRSKVNELTKPRFLPERSGWMSILYSLPIWNSRRSLMPSRRNPFGPMVSTDHTVTVPSWFFTSKWNQACGLVQSTFLSVPVKMMFLVTSNCAWTA